MKHISDALEMELCPDEFYSAFGSFNHHNNLVGVAGQLQCNKLSIFEVLLALFLFSRRQYW